MINVLVIGLSAVVTFLIVNAIVSKHQRKAHELHGHDPRFEAIVKDAVDVSVRVKRLEKTLGGRA